jgi:dTDP-4-amino-4,6-dideoxygalactose transaminase
MSPTPTSAPVQPPVPAKQAFPFLDLRAQFQPIREEVLAAINRVLDSQQFILGREVEQFEAEMAAYIGVEHAVGCASGTDALLLALLALGIGPGDEVITVGFTFVATAGSIVHAGARPVFVDINPVTYNIDPAAVEAAITPRTKAILPVDLFGLLAPMDELESIAAKHNLHIIEDAAQAIGAQRNGRNAGVFGSAACFSFFPSKNLGAAGDGGLVTTHEAKTADRLRQFRMHGSPRRYEYELMGINSRLDAMQAAILRVKLKYLGEWEAGRRENAARYHALFREFEVNDVVLPKETAGSRHIYNQYTIRLKRRDELKAYLAEQGIPSEIYYPYPLHLQPAFKFLGHKPGDFPVTEQACREVLSLPIYPELGAEKQRQVVEAVAKFCHQPATKKG